MFIESISLSDICLVKMCTHFFQEPNWLVVWIWRLFFCRECREPFIMCHRYARTYSMIVIRSIEIPDMECLVASHLRD